MHQVDHAARGGYKSVELFLTDYQGRRHFQDHEIVAADLGQNAVIVIEPHDNDLSEHALVNMAKRFKRRAQLQMAGSLKFDSRHHTHTADFANHLIARERVAKSLAQNFTRDERAFTEILLFENVKRGEARAWTWNFR